jgi:signal peptidase
VSSIAPGSHISDAYARAFQEERASRVWHASVPRWRVRRVLRLVGLAALGLAIGIALAVTAPLAFGYKSFAVLSGSMEPTFSTGDVVVVKQISPLDARLGDIVSFRDPEDPSRILNHRAIRIRVADDAVFFVTKGDANTGVERWQVPQSGTIGRVAYHVPKLGYITNRIGSRFGRLAFLVIPVLLLALSEVWRIWRPEPKGETDAPRG